MDRKGDGCDGLAVAGRRASPLLERHILSDFGASANKLQDPRRNLGNSHRRDENFPFLVVSPG
jgi:hypothetical protein